MKGPYFAALVDDDARPVGPRVPAPVRIRHGQRVTHLLLTGSLEMTTGEEPSSRWAVFDGSGKLLTLGDETQVMPGWSVLFVQQPGLARRALRQDVAAFVSRLPWSIVVIGALLTLGWLVGWYGTSGPVEAVLIGTYAVIASATMNMMPQFWKSLVYGYGWPVYWTVLVVRALRGRS